jgi:ribosomal protein S18 acetylase RimI-like enzyme
MNINRYDEFSPDINEISAEISVLAGEIWREHYTPIIGAEQVEYMLAKFQSPEQISMDIRKNNYVYFTARHSESYEMAGYCAVQPREGHLFLSKIYVCRDERGKGIARGFLNEAQKCGFGLIRLTVNKHNGGAIAMYKKTGFIITDEVKVSIGGGFYMDDYVMEMINEYERKADI